MSVRKDMHVFESQYYRVYKNSVKIIGLWPYANIPIKRFTRICIISLLISLVILQVRINMILAKITLFSII